MSSKKHLEDSEQTMDDTNDAEEEDQFNRMFDMNSRDVWSSGGAKKDIVINDLIKSFSSMIKSVPRKDAEPDMKGRYRPEDYEHSKLLDASRHVNKAKRLLLENENFDTRDFTLYIATKNWAKNQLRPLLELCAKDDSLLAMNILSLGMVLVKRISDRAAKALRKEAKARKKSSLDLTAEDAEDKDQESPEEAAARAKNAREQVAALLSFKDAFCSDLCMEALTNAFKGFWMQEQVASSEENKTGVAICFSFLRRILSISTHPNWSTVGEISTNNLVHSRYIVQTRQILSVIPGICSDLGRPYHNDWLGDIILITYYAIRDFDAAKMFLVWKGGQLISDFADILDAVADPDEEDDPSRRIGSKTKELRAVVVPATLREAGKDRALLRGGGLMDMINRGNNLRTATAISNSAAGYNSNRFRGAYTMTTNHASAKPALVSSAGKGANSVDMDESPTGVAGANGQTLPFSPNEKPGLKPQSARILANPFSTSDGRLPQARAKTSKKNLTFALENNALGGEQVNDCSQAESQQACVVVATLVNLLADEVSLKPLVKRVNEDLRRDEMRITTELELKYFAVLAKVLAFNRLKLTEQHQQFMTRQMAADASAARWEPNLKNVMDALDRMSFTRVLASIEKLSKPAASLGARSHGGGVDDLYVPLTLYKEMISYLRVLLESDIEGHHEIAVAALYRLFYSASNDKLDPLGKLLSAWRPGGFSRAHLNALVELVHETLKTLDTARNRYREDGPAVGNLSPAALAAAQKKAAAKGRKGKKDLDLDQYLAACMRFDVDEYFHRLATNNSVRLYTRLLERYDSNSPQVNHYAFCFLQRMASFKLEQMYRAPMPQPSVSQRGSLALTGSSSDGSQSAADATMEVHLGFMLFNIQTLTVFSALLNDPEIVGTPSPRLKHLEPLVRLVKSLVRRFGAAAAKNRMLFVELLFQHQRPDQFCCLLDSVYEAPMWASTTNHRPGRRNDNSGDDDRSVNSSSSSEEDFGDEFDEHDAGPAFQADQRPTKPSKESRKANRRAERRADRKAIKAAAAAQNKHRKSEWSAAEDEALRELFVLYAGTASVFTSIAQSDQLRSCGGNRSEAQVQRRVAALRLSQSLEYLSEEEEGEGERVGADDGDGTRISVDSESDGEHGMRGNVSAVHNSAEDGAYPQESGDMSSPASNTQRTRSSSQRKKARLVAVDTSLPVAPGGRAAWDLDGSEGDIFEQRSLALAASSGTAGTGKKLIRKRQRSQTANSRSEGSEDEDDAVFRSEGEADGEATQPQAPVESLPRASKASRQMTVADSDDDEMGL